jgi:hypothetical protein
VNRLSKQKIRPPVPGEHQCSETHSSKTGEHLLKLPPLQAVWLYNTPWERHSHGPGGNP